MTSFQGAQLRERVKATDPGNPALGAVDAIDFLEFADLEQSVRDDVEWLKVHPLVLPESQVTGWVYEVETGKVSADLVSVAFGEHVLTRGGDSSVKSFERPLMQAAIAQGFCHLQAITHPREVKRQQDIDHQSMIDISNHDLSCSIQYLSAPKHVV